MTLIAAVCPDSLRSASPPPILQPRHPLLPAFDLPTIPMVDQVDHTRSSQLSPPARQKTARLTVLVGTERLRSFPQARSAQWVDRRSPTSCARRGGGATISLRGRRQALSPCKRPPSRVTGAVWVEIGHRRRRKGKNSICFLARGDRCNPACPRKCVDVAWPRRTGPAPCPGEPALPVLHANAALLRKLLGVPTPTRLHRDAGLWPEPFALCNEGAVLCMYAKRNPEAARG